jgi:hypothetical protein
MSMTLVEGPPASIAEAKMRDVELPENVVRLKRRVWEHSCGSQRYLLIEGGRIECAWCGRVLDSGCWIGD